MFDDHPISQPGGVPSNLPMGEPEDIFANVDHVPTMPMNDVPDTAQSSVLTPPTTPPSALSAGILQPKQPVVERPAVAPMPPPTYVSVPPVPENAETYRITEPKASRGVMIAIVISVLVLVLGAGGWWVYISFVRQANGGAQFDQTTSDSTVIFPGTETDIISPNDVVDVAGINVIPDTSTTGAGSENNDIVATLRDDAVLFGQPIDQDGDGLDDVRESQMGTDPQNWDSDQDGLGDGDEIIIWKTDPLNPDSDGDTYLDGDEVRNGYSPSGSGKIFEPPVDDQGSGTSSIGSAVVQ